jgi:hypothetical protein
MSTLYDIRLEDMPWSDDGKSGAVGGERRITLREVTTKLMRQAIEVTFKAGGRPGVRGYVMHPARRDLQWTMMGSSVPELRQHYCIHTIALGSTKLDQALTKLSLPACKLLLSHSYF